MKKPPDGGGLVRLGSGITPASAPGPACSPFAADGGGLVAQQALPWRNGPGAVGRCHADRRKSGHQRRKFVAAFNGSDHRRLVGLRLLPCLAQDANGDGLGHGC